MNFQSAIDAGTDALVQRAIRSEFPNSLLICISRRPVSALCKYIKFERLIQALLAISDRDPSWITTESLYLMRDASSKMVLLASFLEEITVLSAPSALGRALFRSKFTTILPTSYNLIPHRANLPVPICSLFQHVYPYTIPYIQLCVCLALLLQSL